MLLDIRGEIGDRLGPGLPLQDLRLKERGEFPVGAQPERRACFAQRKLRVLRVPRRLRNRKTGFRHLAVAARQPLHQLQHRRLVLVPGKKRCNLQKTLPDIRLIGAQPFFQVGKRGCELSLIDEQRSEDLTRLLRSGIGLQPDTRRLDGGIDEARVPRDLGCTLGDARVAGLARNVEVRRHGHVRLGALDRHFSQQQLEHELLGEFVCGKRGLRRRFRDHFRLRLRRPCGRRRFARRGRRWLLRTGGKQHAHGERERSGIHHSVAADRGRAGQFREIKEKTAGAAS